MDAIKAGFDYMKKKAADFPTMQLEKADGKNRMFMIGNDAIALGAVAGWLPFYGCLPNYTSF